MNKVLVDRFVISTFVTLYVVTSLISTVHVVDFFELSNPKWMAISLAIAFELGAAASLASLIVLDRMNKGLIWTLFITITLMQVQGNLYFAFKNVHDYQQWSELFDLVEGDTLQQRRILAFVSGAILPLVALGFIKSLIDYIKPDTAQAPTITEELVKAVEPDPSEKKTKVDAIVEIEIEPEVEIDSVEPKEIIENARDLNRFLDNSMQGGLINGQPSRRTIGNDSRPTGFMHPDLSNNA